jgi:mannose-6-phosphate isomerase-like protein (cupin superfamily)
MMNVQANKVTDKIGENYETYFAQEGCWISEWWNTPEDEAVSIARARIEPGVTTHWHKLRGIAERHFILEGEGRAEVGDAPPRDVVPGHSVAIPPGTLQRITNTGASDLVFLAVCTPRFRIEAYESLPDTN